VFVLGDTTFPRRPDAVSAHQVGQTTIHIYLPPFVWGSSRYQTALAEFRLKGQDVKCPNCHDGEDPMAISVIEYVRKHSRAISILRLD
jgi:hypothetical protein